MFLDFWPPLNQCLAASLSHQQKTHLPIKLVTDPTTFFPYFPSATHNSQLLSNQTEMCGEKKSNENKSAQQKSKQNCNKSAAER